VYFAVAQTGASALPKIFNVDPPTYLLGLRSYHFLQVTLRTLHPKYFKTLQFLSPPPIPSLILHALPLPFPPSPPPLTSITPDPQSNHGYLPPQDPAFTRPLVELPSIMVSSVALREPTPSSTLGDDVPLSRSSSSAKPTLTRMESTYKDPHGRVVWKKLIAVVAVSCVIGAVSIALISGVASKKVGGALL